MKINYDDLERVTLQGAIVYYRKQLMEHGGKIFDMNKLPSGWIEGELTRLAELEDKIEEAYIEESRENEKRGVKYGESKASHD